MGQVRSRSGQILKEDRRHSAGDFSVRASAIFNLIEKSLNFCTIVNKLSFKLSSKISYMNCIGWFITYLEPKLTKKISKK